MLIAQGRAKRGRLQNSVGGKSEPDYERKDTQIGRHKIGTRIDNPDTTPLVAVEAGSCDGGGRPKGRTNDSFVVRSG